jgi:hypothetical protein
MIGAVAGVADELSLDLSGGACAGADTDELSVGFSNGAGAGTGCRLAVSAGVPGVPASVGR